jgi:hypothetical protein
VAGAFHQALNAASKARPEFLRPSTHRSVQALFQLVKERLAVFVFSFEIHDFANVF